MKTNTTCLMMLTLTLSIPCVLAGHSSAPSAKIPSMNSAIRRPIKLPSMQTMRPAAPLYRAAVPPARMVNPIAPPVSVARPIAPPIQVAKPAVKAPAAINPILRQPVLVKPIARPNLALNPSARAEMPSIAKLPPRSAIQRPPVDAKPDHGGSLGSGSGQGFSENRNTADIGIKAPAVAAIPNKAPAIRNTPDARLGGLSRNQAAGIREGMDIHESLASLESLRASAGEVEGLGNGFPRPSHRGPSGADNPVLGGPAQGSEFEGQLEGITKLTGRSNRERMSETSQGFLNGVVSDPSTQMSNARNGRTRSDSGAKDPDGKILDYPGTMSRTDNPDGTVTTTENRHDGQGQVVTQTRDTTDGSGVVRREESVQLGDATETHTATRHADGTYTHQTERRSAGESGSIGRIWSSRSPVRSVDPDSSHGGGSGQSLPLHRKKDTIMEATLKKMGSTVLPPSPDSGSSAGAGAPRLNVDVDLTGQPNPDAIGGGGGSNFLEKPILPVEVNPGR